MSIVSRQNEPLQIRRLAAQRNLYARVKYALGWHMVLSIPIAILFAVAVALFPEVRPYGITYGAAVLLIGELWLVPRQKKFREMGAKVQEAFDCYVLELPWSNVKAGNPVNGEVEIDEAQRYQAWAHRMTPLPDWYSTHVDRLPLSIGRICCQRTNCWWDGTQRRLYARIAMVALVFLLIGAFAIGWFSNLNFVDVVVSVFVPLLPGIVICIRHYKDHSDAANRLDELMRLASALFDEACKDATSQKLLDKSRELQNEIFEGRKRNQPIFDWIFKRLRDRHEKQMFMSTDDLATEAERRIGKMVP